MLAEAHPQIPLAAKRANIIRLVEEIVAESQWREITGIFAYATSGGLLDLLTPIETLSPAPTLRWLFGLDDCLTEPGAIDLVRAQGNVVRVASLLESRCRFHPKVLHFAGNDKMNDIAIVGSANLTISGLTRNAEAIAILRSESRADNSALREFVSLLFELGHEPTEIELGSYRQAYKSARPFHRKVARLSVRASTRKQPSQKPGEDDSAISGSQGLDPTIATRCWIEVGKNTAQGRELEIKAEQALFFRLHHSGGERQERKFNLSDGSTIPMNFKYQGNAMWRLQMRNEVPEVRKGLRPIVGGQLGRSPFVAVFERTSSRANYSLRFVHESSAAYQRLRRDARLHGTIGSTTTRKYGWS